MHICFLSHEYPLWSSGGVGSFIQTLGRKLVEKGHSVSVLGVADIKEEIVHHDCGITLYQIPGEKLIRPRAIGNGYRINCKLRKIHASKGIDILEASELGLAFIDSSLPFKKIIRMHGGHRFFATTLGKKPAMWRSIQEKRSFERADHLVAVSRFVGSSTMGLLQTPEREFEVIYNPVDTSSFYMSSAEKVVGNSLLFIGTVCEKKGVRQLVEAMPYIKQRHPDAHLHIVGRDWLDPKTGNSYTKMLREQIPNDCRASIQLHGEVPHNQIPYYLEKAQVCVLPSHMEAMPLAWLEVLAMGKPFVGSKIGPGYEAVKLGETGLLCDPYDPKDIADKVSYLLDHPTESRCMGELAREDILERFSIENIVEQNIRFYEGCLD